MTDNFEQIRSLLKLEDDYFYFIQIIQRKKEIPELGSNNRVVRSYMISTLDKFDKCKDEIISMCKHYNARAYIHLNRRKWNRISLECLRHTAELIANGQHDAIKSSLETVIGRHNCEPTDSRTWIVDIDTKDSIVLDRIVNVIEALAVRPKILSCLTTKNGYHLITEKFNTQAFNKHLSLQGDTSLQVDIHKDNPTILYTS